MLRACTCIAVDTGGGLTLLAWAGCPSVTVKATPRATAHAMLGPDA